MKRLVFTLLVLLYSVGASTASAHSGRTNAYGCHNCYTSYCYGEYHCHGGGYVPSGPIYTLPAPVNPNNGNWNYRISTENWCNYDLDITWNKPVSGDRFSIAVSKYAGADPGPLVDTVSFSYTFKNLSYGKWFVNIKTGNRERWSSVSYWTVNLPQPNPAFSTYLETSGGNQYLVYDISCMKKVEGPSEFIDYLRTNNNKPSGKVLLTYDSPTNISIKGWDNNEKEYSNSLSYIPLVASANEVVKEKTDWSSILVLLFFGGWIGFGILKWIYGGIKKLFIKKLDP